MNGESLNSKFYETQASVKEPCFLSPGLKGKLVQDTSSVVPVIPLSPIFRYVYSLHSPTDWSTEGKGILTNSGKKKEKVRKKIMVKICLALKTRQPRAMSLTRINSSDIQESYETRHHSHPRGEEREAQRCDILRPRTTEW